MTTRSILTGIVRGLALARKRRWCWCWLGLRIAKVSVSTCIILSAIPCRLAALCFAAGLAILLLVRSARHDGRGREYDATQRVALGRIEQQRLRFRSQHDMDRRELDQQVSDVGTQK